MPRSSKPKSQAFLVIPSTGTVVNLTMQQAQPFLEGGVAAKTEPAVKAAPAKKATQAKTAGKSAPKAKTAKASKAKAAPAVAEAKLPEAPKTIAAKAGKSAPKIAKPGKTAKPAKAATAEATKPSASMNDVREAAKRVILRHGRPMPRRELFKTLTSGRNGLAIAGKDPVENMATMLYKDRDKSFENLKGQGFWLKGEPLPTGDRDNAQS